MSVARIVSEIFRVK